MEERKIADRLKRVVRVQLLQIWHEIWDNNNKFMLLLLFRFEKPVDDHCFIKNKKEHKIRTNSPGIL